ncbi:unnamed protein product [Lampetra planeri]
MDVDPPPFRPRWQRFSGPPCPRRCGIAQLVQVVDDTGTAGGRRGATVAQCTVPSCAEAAPTVERRSVVVVVVVVEEEGKDDEGEDEEGFREPSRRALHSGGGDARAPAGAQRHRSPAREGPRAALFLRAHSHHLHRETGTTLRTLL